jgi:hypothetical protein
MPEWLGFWAYPLALTLVILWCMLIVTKERRNYKRAQIRLKADLEYQKWKKERGL